jgi:hypothetical protein
MRRQRGSLDHDFIRLVGQRRLVNRPRAALNGNKKSSNFDVIILATKERAPNGDTPPLQSDPNFTMQLSPSSPIGTKANAMKLVCFQK